MSCMSGPWIRPLAFRDIYEIRKLAGPKPFVTGSGGIMTLQDVVMAAMCGGDLMCICTGILLKGYELLPPLIAELKAYLDKMGYKKLSDMRDILVAGHHAGDEADDPQGLRAQEEPFPARPVPGGLPVRGAGAGLRDARRRGRFPGRVPDDHEPQPAAVHLRLGLQPPVRDGMHARRNWTSRSASATSSASSSRRRRAKAGSRRSSKGPARKEKVAVVGSGPAGLSAAYHLARAGYPVTRLRGARRKPAACCATPSRASACPRACSTRRSRRSPRWA